MKVISLGWGVQSWTLAAMVALGELEPVDYAVHSNTTWEMSYTYEFAKQWTPWLEERGVKVVTVSDISCAGKVVKKDSGIFIPAFTTSDRKLYGYRDDGGQIISWADLQELEEQGLTGGNHYEKVEIGVHKSNGQLRRQCTNRWKIVPMRRWWNEFRNGESVELWLGITFDEVFRAKVSDVKYITNRWPFLENRGTRQDCLLWLGKNNLPSPGKSSCTFCPYHSRRFFENMKRENSVDWCQAVDVDAAIRDKRPPYPLFVHPARKPLPEAVRIPEDEGYVQSELFDTSDICDSGYCFL